MIPPVSDTAPGWYPDPHRRHESRYWDGGCWTEHVSDGGAPAVDPTDSPPVTPAPAWSPFAAGAPVDTRDRVFAIVGLVAAAVLLVAAFLPWFEVSIDFAGVSASETVAGIDGTDGVIVIVFALVAGVLAVLRVLGKGAPQVGIGMAVVGLLATIVGLVDLGNDDPDTDAPLAALADVDPAVGLWLVILAGLVVAVTGALIVLAGRSRPAVA